MYKSYRLKTIFFTSHLYSSLLKKRKKEKYKQNGLFAAYIIPQNKPSCECFILAADPILPSLSLLFYRDSVLAPANSSSSMKKRPFLPLTLFKIFLGEVFPVS